MKMQTTWTGGMKFIATAGNHSAPMDAKTPIGSDSAMSPKELMAAGLGGCTAMDVIALLKKHKQETESLEIDIEITTSNSGQPVVFTSALLTFTATGAIDPAILNEAVRLSQTKYCGVSAMLSKAFPIDYVVILNGMRIGQGRAEF